MATSVLSDLRYGLRRLLRRPSFTLVVLITLALGIGINTAIFSVVNAVLLRPLPFPESDDVVMVWQASLPTKERVVPVSPANYFDWREQNEVFESTTAYLNWNLNLTGGDQPEKVRGSYVFPSFFDVLRVEPAIGRTFRPEEEQVGNDKVVVLSDGLWRTRFGGDPSILSRTMTLDDESFVVIGVMPPDFRFPNDEIQLWLPIAFEPDQISRGAQYLSTLARLRPGVGLEQARSNMDAIASRLEEEYPEDNRGWGAKVVSLREQLVGDVQPTLLILLGAVGFLLLIACVNIANLLLAQASTRQQEIAVRTALGASRGRLVRQLVNEAVVLALAGGALGLVLAARGTDLLVAMSAGTLPRGQEVGLDSTVLVYTLLLSLVTGLLFGVMPARESLKADLSSSVKEGGRGGAGIAGRRLRAALVVAEIGLAVMLLIGGALMLRSFAELRSQDPGFEPENVLSVAVSLPDATYDTPGEVIGFFRTAIEQLGERTGVERVGSISVLPLSGFAAYRRFTIDGRPATPGEEPSAGNNVVTPGYFETLKIQLVQGRTFTWEDGPEAPFVAAVSRSAAEAFWPGKNPIGERIRFGDAESDDPLRTIVGVVGDIKHTGLGDDPRPEVYVPLSQELRQEQTLLIRVQGSDPMQIVPSVRGEVAALDPDLPLSRIMSLEEVVSRSIDRPRFYTVLLNLFAVVGLILTMVGIAGMMSYNVERRTREIGIRMALGAKRGDVLVMILRHSLKLALIGVGAGVIGALLASRFLAAYLYGISTTDPMSFIAIPLLLLAVALLAAWLPARRATRTEPVTALRYE